MLGECAASWGGECAAMLPAGTAPSWFFRVRAFPRKRW